ncbi:MAG: hypothetical protein ACYSWX_06000 [Planctomycetota bacterium]
MSYDFLHAGALQESSTRFGATAMFFRRHRCIRGLEAQREGRGQFGSSMGPANSPAERARQALGEQR